MSEAYGQHAHHWQLEPPAGPTSIGTCLACGVRRAFGNVYRQDVEMSAHERRELQRAKSLHSLARLPSGTRMWEHIAELVL